MSDLADKKSGPAAKRIIEEKELDPSEIHGSGKDEGLQKLMLLVTLRRIQ